MPLLTDLAGLGLFGKRAQGWASNLPGSGQTDPTKQRKRPDESGEVEGAGSIPGSGMEDDQPRRQKRSNGKTRY